MTKQPIIKLSNVSKSYQRGSEIVHAVQNVSLSIDAGEYIAIVGHSGSGKTTLMNIMGCLDRASSGTVELEGNNLSSASEQTLTEVRKERIGFIFQQFFLIPTLTVLENVELPALFSKRRGMEKRARELVELVGLGKRTGHLPGQLSGGEMQRVAIARSLINTPKILLADEPTGNLDSANTANIMSIFKQLHQSGMTIVVVTHNPELVKECGKVVHIEDGIIKA